MKVKHWAGYGSVSAERVAKSDNAVIIKVAGNHECGLKPYYPECFDWDRWLGKRFRIGEFVRVEADEWWSDKEKSDVMRVVFYK